MAVSPEPRANRRTWARVKQTRLTYAMPGTSRRWRAARNVRKNRAAGGVTVLAPPARRCRSSPPRKARRRALLQTPRPAERRAWQGRRWAAPVDARHAGRVPALPPPAWARSSVGPPERRAEAGCVSPVATVEAAVAARLVPPVFSSSFSGARAKRKRPRIDGLHSPKGMPPMAAAASQEKSASRAVWTTAQLA